MAIATSGLNLYNLDSFQQLSSTSLSTIAKKGSHMFLGKLLLIP